MRPREEAKLQSPGPEGRAASGECFAPNHAGGGGRSWPEQGGDGAGDSVARASRARARARAGERVRIEREWFGPTEPSPLL